MTLATIFAWHLLGAFINVDFAVGSALSRVAFAQISAENVSTFGRHCRTRRRTRVAALRQHVTQIVATKLRRTIALETGHRAQRLVANAAVTTRIQRAKIRSRFAKRSRVSAWTGAHNGGRCVVLLAGSTIQTGPVDAFDARSSLTIVADESGGALALIIVACARGLASSAIKTRL